MPESNSTRFSGEFQSRAHDVRYMSEGAGRITGDIKTLREKIRAARGGTASAQAEIAYARYMRSQGYHVHFNTPPNLATRHADFTIYGTQQVDVKYLSGIGRRAAGDIAKGVEQVGNNGRVVVVRNSASNNTLSQFEEFVSNFKPSNPTVSIKVISQSVLQPFWR